MNDWGRRIVGVMQIANGATGFISSLAVLVVRSTVRGPLYLEFLFCLFSGLLIAAGVLVLEKQPRGLSLSKYLQLFAAPILFSSVFSYQLLSGLTARAGLGTASGFQMFWANGLMVRLFPEDGVYVGLNILAVGVFFYLRSCSFDQGASLEERRLQAVD